VTRVHEQENVFVIMPAALTCWWWQIPLVELSAATGTGRDGDPLHTRKAERAE